MDNNKKMKIIDNAMNMLDKELGDSARTAIVIVIDSETSEMSIASGLMRESTIALLGEAFRKTLTGMPVFDSDSRN